MSKDNALLNRGTSRKPLYFYLDSENFSLRVPEKGHYGVILGNRKFKEFSTRSGLLKYLSIWSGYLLTFYSDALVSLVDLDTNEFLCYLGVPNVYLNRLDENNAQLVFSSDDDVDF